MNPFGIKEELVYERYKKQKLTISTGFLRIIMNFFVVSLGIYLLLCLTIIDSTSTKNWSLIFLFIMSIIVQLLNKNVKLSYILGICFSALMEFRTMQLGLLNFPEHLSLFCAMSFFYLWHCQLEFVYSKVQGYIIILLHAVMWCFCTYYSGCITKYPPPQIIVGLIYFIVIQLLWFKYQSSKDYEEIRIKLDLERSDSNVKNLINAIPEGILVLDHCLELLMSNNAFQKLMQGHSIFELKINRRFNIKERNICEDLVKYVKEFISGQETTTTFGVCCLNDFYIECTGNKAEWNNKVAIVLTFRDVSNVIKLQSEVDTTSKTLQMLQGISHELKTPLNKIIHDHREVLNSPEEMSECIKKHVVRSLNSAKNLLSLIKDMIDYSHIKVNNLHLHPEWINVERMILDCIQMFKDINSEYRIAFKKNFTDIINIYSDRSRFKQCLLNLFSFSFG